MSGSLTSFRPASFRQASFGLASFGRCRTPRALAALSAVMLTVVQPASLAFAETNASRRPIAQSIATAEPAPSPLIIVASIKKQRVRLYDRNGEISNARISSGMTGFDTPTGVFAIIQKNKNHVSNIYGAAMPFMQRLTWSGIALHAGPLPGYRASHGCVRMPHSYAKKLFSTTQMGTRVIISHEETRPIEFSHPNLLRPLPATVAEGTQVAQAGDGLTLGGQASKTDAFETKSTLHDLINLPRYFWFTPALAEAVANLPPESRPPQTRQEADQFVRDQIARLQQDVDATRTAQEKAEAAERDAKNKIRDVGRQLKTVTNDHKKLSRDVDTLAKRMAAAQSRFDAFLRGQGDELTSGKMALSEIEQREADFEDEILELAHTIDAAEKGIPPLAKDMDRLTDELIKLEDQSASESRQAAQAKNDIKFAMTALDAAKREVARRRKPVSVFVSLRNKRVYVRQGFEAVIDAPIQMNGTPRRFGTHVFTAMGYDGADSNAFEWQLVTAQPPALRNSSSKKKSSRTMRLTEDMQRQFAAAALESFAFPEDVAGMLRELARPGASLIISDLALPTHENGKGTDFVILTK